MAFIAFLGCDGSGKSAVIQGVAARLEANGHPVTLGHWRPKPFAPISGDTESAADDPHGQKPRAFASSVLKLGWLWLNWWVAWFQYLRRDSRHDFVLFDRYHGDLLVDPRRYRYGGPLWLARLSSRWMPQPDIVFFLDAPPEVLLARKQEVGFAALQESRSRYLTLTRTGTRMRVIDAAGPLEVVIADVIRQLCLAEKELGVRV
jgi:thymidylate kinase